MTLATIITILGLVNGLLNVVKDAPVVIDEAKSLLAKVEPFIDQANDDIQAQFEALRARAG